MFKYLMEYEAVNHNNIYSGNMGKIIIFYSGTIGKLDSPMVMVVQYGSV